MVGNVHAGGQLRNFDSPLPLVFDIDDPSENGCNFIGFVFVFPIEAFVVAQPLDAQQRVEFADVVVLKVEGVKHVGFYEFLHFYTNISRLRATIIQLQNIFDDN